MSVNTARTLYSIAGYTAYMGTYDDHDHWDYILIKGEKPEIVAQHTECDSWTDEMWEEALSILDTVCFDEGKTEGGKCLYSGLSPDGAVYYRRSGWESLINTIRV